MAKKKPEEVIIDLGAGTGIVNKEQYEEFEKTWRDSDPIRIDIDDIEELLEDAVAEEEEISIPKSEYDLVVSVLNEVLDRERIDFVQKTKYRKRAGI